MTQINVGDLFMDTVYADIIFVVDTEEIPGHRLVLAKTCDYFDKLLFGDFLESKSKKVEVNGASANVFKEVLRFTYKGQLEVEKWTIEDLMSLLAATHEYQFQPMFSAVIKAIKGQPLDFGSWSLVNSAAWVYDSEEVGRKCAAFAEEKIEDFMGEKDLEKFSAALICCMFDSPKMSGFNHDHVVKAICNWKKNQSSFDIMSVMQKLNWETVSPKFTAIVLRDLLSTSRNLEEHKFWQQLSTDIQGYSESNALNGVLRVDSVLLTKDMKMKFALPENKGNFFWRLLSDRLAFWLKKDSSFIDIPVKSIVFEVSTKFNIERIMGGNLEGETADMVVFEPTSNNGWFKYTALFSDATPVYSINIVSEDFINMPEISLQNIIIT